MTISTKIPTYGYYLSVIDYGQVLHNKHKHKDEFYRKYSKAMQLKEIKRGVFDMLLNESKYIEESKKQKKKIYWERDVDFVYKALKKIHKNYPDLWADIKNITMDHFPRTKKYYETFEKYGNFKDVINYRKNLFTRIIVFGIMQFFMLHHPKKYKEYFKWATHHRPMLPKKEIESMMRIKSTDNLIKYNMAKLNL
jgi:hypothetical protein